MKDLGMASGQSPTTPEPMLEPELIPESEPTLEPESRPETRAEKPLEPLALEATSTEQNPNGPSSEPELDPELLEALGVEDADHPELSLIVHMKDLGMASGQSPTTPEPMLEPELIPEPEPTLELESRPETRAEKPLEPLALEATSTEQNPNGPSSEPELDPELLEALGK
ncbi:unnamed protein product [Parnassius apollo]|uniref:(apollo) hypothetical protein n=1 Tax=Parnassius apollo TaxID=110799 RepID=A0A8S3WGF2_PARAO|nr:unnamed protein product [Parnassius apollo]